jgi:hypothetical protein
MVTGHEGGAAAASVIARVRATGESLLPRHHVPFLVHQSPPRTACACVRIAAAAARAHAGCDPADAQLGLRLPAGGVPAALPPCSCATACKFRCAAAPAAARCLPASGPTARGRSPRLGTAAAMALSRCARRRRRQPRRRAGGARLADRDSRTEMPCRRRTRRSVARWAGTRATLSTTGTQCRSCCSCSCCTAHLCAAFPLRPTHARQARRRRCAPPSQIWMQRCCRTTPPTPCSRHGPHFAPAP